MPDKLSNSGCEVCGSILNPTAEWAQKKGKTYVICVSCELQNFGFCHYKSCTEIIKVIHPHYLYNDIYCNFCKNSQKWK